LFAFYYLVIEQSKLGLTKQLHEQCYVIN